MKHISEIVPVVLRPPWLKAPAEAEQLELFPFRGVEVGAPKLLGWHNTSCSITLQRRAK